MGIILPPDFDPEALLAQLDATLQQMKQQERLSPVWSEALEIVQAEEHCSAEEFARSMGLL